MTEERTEAELISLAKRYNNSKRKYLLVNPVQGKHVPAEPRRSFGLMDALGEKLRSEYGNADILISFAETSTAIGARVAGFFPHCFYVQTTRENIGTERENIFFSEEHSHASAQRLYVGGLEKHISHAATVVLLDDEITTGKTVINLVGQLAVRFPQLKDARLVCASVVNRMSGKNAEAFAERGIESVSILHLPFEDYTDIVGGLPAEAPSEPAGGAFCPWERVSPVNWLPDPRYGVSSSDFHARSRAFAEELCASFADLRGKIVVLGTEEYMYPAMLFADRLAAHTGNAVYFHATTRSPIGVLDAEGYPIRNGYRISSAYEKGRITYIYDLDKYDAAILISDGENAGDLLGELGGLLGGYGCRKLYYVRGKSVRNL